MEQPLPYHYGQNPSPNFRPLPTLRANPFFNQWILKWTCREGFRRTTRVVNREDLALALREPPERKTIRNKEKSDLMSENGQKVLLFKKTAF